MVVAASKVMRCDRGSDSYCMCFPVRFLVRRLPIPAPRLGTSELSLAPVAALPYRMLATRRALDGAGAGVP